MTWDTEKNVFNERKAALDAATTNSAIDSLATEINRGIKTYSSNGGISSNPTRNQAQIDTNVSFGRLIDLEKQYKSLINDLTNKVKTLSGNADITSKLQSVGTLRNDINNLEETLNNVKQDVDTSRNRKESVEDTESKVSWYQGFSSRVGFSKPLHQISVPILIGFGIFLLCMSGLILKELFQSPDQINSTVYDSDSLFSLFTDSRLYSVIGAIVLIFVVLGILSYRGYFGKSIN